MFFSISPLHIRSKYQDTPASYVNTDHRNIIHPSIQTQGIKLKEVSVSRRTKIYYRKIENEDRNLLDESSKDTLMYKANNNIILK